CLGAPKVNAQLVVETVGISNLCEHVPSPIMWNVISDIAARALGNAIPAPPPIVKATEKPEIKSGPIAKPLSIGSPPPPVERPELPRAASSPGPAIPSPTASGNHAVPVAVDDVVAELDAESSPVPVRSRTATNNRFRQTNTNIGRLASANQSRRPQAAVPAPPTP